MPVVPVVPEVAIPEPVPAATETIAEAETKTATETTKTEDVYVWHDGGSNDDSVPVSLVDVDEDLLLAPPDIELQAEDAPNT